MSVYPCAMVMNGKVYVGGGGWELSDGQSNQTVMIYDLRFDMWTELPSYYYAHFGMAIVNSQLVLVGGVHPANEVSTTMLGVWDEQSRAWTNPYPPMPIAHRSPSVVTYDNKWLVVVGGRIGDLLSNVDILDTTSGQWYKGAPVPRLCSHASAATIGNTCYIVGGYIDSGGSGSNKVFRAHLDELISQAVSQQASEASPLPTPSLWQMLPNTPMTRSTALAFNGALLAVGGEKYWTVKKDIYLYQPSNNTWVRAGKLPTGRRCACTVLPSGEVFVVGGSVGGGIGVLSNEPAKIVEIALIQ